MTVPHESIVLERRTPANLAVIIVNHNDPRLGETVHAVKDTAPPGQTEIVVADNASHDASIKEVEAAFRSLHVLRFPENLGFAGACNRAAAAIQSKHLLFLKPGIEIQPRTLQRCLSFMNRFPQVGVASCRVVESDGRLVDVCREMPNIPSTLLYGFWWLPSRLRPVRHFLGRWMTRYHDGTYDRYVGYNDVPFLLVKRESFERAGGFDENMISGGEIRDFYQRVADVGFRGAFLAEAEVVRHAASEDTALEIRRDVGRWRELIHYLGRYGSPRTIRFFTRLGRLEARCGQIAASLGVPRHSSLRLRANRKILRLLKTSRQTDPGT